MSLELIIYLLGMVSQFNAFLAFSLTFSLVVSVFVIVVNIDKGGLKSSHFILPIVFLVLCFLVIITPSKATAEKIVAVHLGKELIDKTPQELKDELAKLPINVVEKLNEILETKKDEK